MNEVNLELMLKELYEGVISGDQRFVIDPKNGYTNIQDTTLGLTYHLHKDKPYEIYHGETKLIDGATTMTSAEANILDHVDKAILKHMRMKIHNIWEQSKVNSVKPDAIAMGEQETNGNYKG